MSTHRKTRVFIRKTDFPELFRKLGLIPPDTEFNRRAHAYAVEAARMAETRRYRKKPKT